MEPYVPRPQRGPSVRGGFYRKDEFSYEPGTDSFLCPAGQRLGAQTQQLAQLRTQSAELAEAITLAQDFATLVRQRQPEALDPWLLRATTSALEAMRHFALGLYEDYAAVKAGVTPALE